MNGVSPEAVDGISIAYIDTRATPSQLVEVSIEAAVVLDVVLAAVHARGAVLHGLERHARGL